MTASSSCASSRALALGAIQGLPRVVRHPLRGVHGAGIAASGDTEQVEEPLDRVEDPELLLAAREALHRLLDVAFVACQDVGLSPDLLVDVIDEVLLPDRVRFQNANVDLGAYEPFREVLERGPERVVEDRSSENPVVLDEPGVVDLLGGRHGVGDEDHGRELVDALADPVLALQLVEQIGDRQLVVGVLDLVERRGFRFRRLAAVDLHAMLLPILLRALEHALAHLLLGLSRILAGFTAAALRGCDGEAVAAEGFCALMLKCVFSCALLTISPSARVVSLDSDRRVWRLSSISLVARDFFVTTRVV